MKKRGFTLIELLIVIAIIAILALIAVPNFIEAQTRAKVSRVMADMRSVGTAIEAYAIDWSRYPVYCHPLDYDDANGETWQWLTYVPVTLTTPQAYMTSLMVDPFRTAAVSTNDPRRPYIYRHAVDQGTTAFVDFDESLVNDSIEVNAFYRMEKYFVSCDPINQNVLEGRSGNMWFVHSPGPDLLSPIWAAPREATPDPTDMPLPYDPTNGTVSEGDIMRWGPGGNARQ